MHTKNFSRFYGREYFANFSLLTGSVAYPFREPFLVLAIAATTVTATTRIAIAPGIVMTAIFVVVLVMLMVPTIIMAARTA